GPAVFFAGLVHPQGRFFQKPVHRPYIVGDVALDPAIGGGSSGPLFAVLIGRFARLVLKSAVKRCIMGVAAGLGNGRDGLIRLPEQLLRSLNPHMMDVVIDGTAQNTLPATV